jgi:hypothetical protein
MSQAEISLHYDLSLARARNRELQVRVANQCCVDAFEACRRTSLALVTPCMQLPVWISKPRPVLGRCCRMLLACSASVSLSPVSRVGC